MVSEALFALLRANIAASLAIALVLLLRLPTRRLFGAQLAYALWLAVPAAMVGALIAVSTSPGPGAAVGTLNHAAKAWLAGPGRMSEVGELWLGGVAAALSLVIFSQLRFLAAAKAGRAGPAVTGVVHARLVAPKDFAERFTPNERALIRAHERAHIDRMDPRANALAVAIQCLGWFNPFLHVGAHAMRLDQELACDATVIARLPRERRRYAEALLKTGLGQTSGSPLTCHWAARGAHPLEARIEMLTRPPLSQARRDVGAGVLVALGIAAAYAAWAVQPPQPPWLALVVTLPIAVMFELG